MTETYRIAHYERNGHDIFQDWLDGLQYMKTRNTIQKRIDRVEDGNFGNHHSCRDGMSELVIDTARDTASTIPLSGMSLFFCYAQVIKAPSRKILTRPLIICAISRKGTEYHGCQ